MNELTQTSELDRAFIKQIAFEVDDGFTKTLPQAIVANFDEVKDFIVKQTENDRLAVVTEDSIDAFKKRKSLLNKQRDAINAQKIEIHKLWDEPYKNFEDKCKELLGIFDGAIKNIDEQLKNFDLSEKEKKREILSAYWSDKAHDVVEYRLYSQIENPKWLNKSVRNETIYSEMDEIANRVRQDITVIKALKAHNENTLLALYKRGTTLTEILEIKNNTGIPETNENKNSGNTAETQNPLDSGDVMTINMAVTATAMQFTLLRGFFKENGIKFEKI